MRDPVDDWLNEMQPGNQRRRQELLREVKEVFGAVIGAGAGKLSVQQAARILNVSRQTVHRYLNGEVIPKTEVLMTAFQAWGLVLRYRDIEVTKITSASTPALKIAESEQLGLFDHLGLVEDCGAEVSLVPKSVESARLSGRKKLRA